MMVHQEASLSLHQGEPNEESIVKHVARVAALSNVDEKSGDLAGELWSSSCSDSPGTSCTQPEACEK